MNPNLSANTQAILLLTAPLIAGPRSAPPNDLLTPGEYKRLARHLHQLSREPADLLSSHADEALRDAQAVVDAERLKRLLARGFTLSQAIERWQTRAIWVVSRADPDYPQRLRDRLKDDRPAVLYGCGERSILDSGGLAVVGSRAVDEALVEYTESVGALTARARKTLVSGGARGIDQAAMRGALAAGGRATGVLADSLEKTAMNREQRTMLMDGQLVLISPYDPGAGFNVGHAMQRNKLIYAFADAALVVSSDYEKGGTWAGAIEQLHKLRLVPVFVRSTDPSSKGLEALARKGALPWPNPEDREALEDLLSSASAPRPTAIQSPLFAQTATSDASARASREEGTLAAEQLQPPHPGELAASATDDTGESPEQAAALDDERLEIPSLASLDPLSPPLPQPEETTPSPAETLFAAVRVALPRVLTIPKKESEIASELQLTTTQAREWLQRLADEGAVEKGPKKSFYQLPGRLLQTPPRT
jgi:DNA processing protein